jgi:UDP-N-acetylmuramyl tripeptide synthase
MATNKDIIVIAGKGDDDYMAIGEEYIPYEKDENVVLTYFKTKYYSEL